jgi:hypothetical protein
VSEVLVSTLRVTILTCAFMLFIRRKHSHGFEAIDEPAVSSS